jgi:hypothetical protein
MATTASEITGPWTQQALSLEGAGLTPDEIATQLGKPVGNVVSWLTSATAAQQRQGLLVTRYGTLKLAVEGLLKESLIPATLNLIKIATTSQSPTALQAVERIMGRVLGTDKSGMNLDIGTSAGVASAVDRLSDFFGDNPAIFQKVAQRLGKGDGSNGENALSPGGSTPNVIPIRRAVSSRGESAPEQVESTSTKTA